MRCKPVCTTGTSQTLKFRAVVRKLGVFERVQAVAETPLGDPQQVEAGTQHFADHDWEVEAEPSEYAHAKESKIEQTQF